MDDIEAKWLTSVGMRIRLRRVARGWTQHHLAERAAVSRNTVSSLEQGHQDVHLLLLWRIADALGLPIGDLLG